MAATNGPATPIPTGSVAPAPQPSTAPQSMSLRSAPDFAMPGNPYGAAAASPGRPY
jgi:hypothetical protein